MGGKSEYGVAGGISGHYPGRGLVLWAAVLSLVLGLAVILPSVLLLVNTSTWHHVNKSIQRWLVENHWDRQVTQTVARCFHWLDVHHEPLLGGLVLSWVLHVLFSLLLLLGAMLHRRALLVPWLCSDMILLVVMVVTFVSWTFLSFFVDLLVAVIFPVAAGLFLGLWIFLWRGVRRHYRQLGAAGYRPVTVQQVHSQPALAGSHQQHQQAHHHQQGRPLPPVMEGE